MSSFSSGKRPNEYCRREDLQAHPTPNRSMDQNVHVQRMDMRPCDKCKTEIYVANITCVQLSAPNARICPLRIASRPRNDLRLVVLEIIRKIPTPIKIKSALPPPPPPNPKYPAPPSNEEFYGHRFSCRKNAFFQARIKLAQPFLERGKGPPPPRFQPY